MLYTSHYFKLWTHFFVPKLNLSSSFNSKCCNLQNQWMMEWARFAQNAICYLVRRWVEWALVILPERSQWDLDILPDLSHGWKIRGQFTILPPAGVQILNLGRDHPGALWFLEWMSAEDSASHLGWIFAWPLEQIDQSMAICRVESKCNLLARHCHLLHILTQLDLRLLVDLDQFVDAAQCRLALASHWNYVNKFRANVAYCICAFVLPRCVPMPKQSMECPWSLSERIVSSLMSFDATIMSVANHGTSYVCAMPTNVSLATRDKYARSPESIRIPRER